MAAMKVEYIEAQRKRRFYVNEPIQLLGLAFPDIRRKAGRSRLLQEGIYL